MKSWLSLQLSSPASLQTQLHLSREHRDALSRADLSSPGAVGACTAAAEALSACMDVPIHPSESGAGIYPTGSHPAPSRAAQPRSVPEPPLLEGIFPGIRSHAGGAALQAASEKQEYKDWIWEANEQHGSGGTWQVQS